MERKSPKVSVVMSVYNGEKYVEEAITSILNQTFADFEFIIIDDCSTDASAKIIRSFSDSRIKYIRNTHNIKLAASLNKGIQAASGEYIARMDADDISLKHRLQKQVDFLDNHVNVGVVGAWVESFGNSGCIMKYPSDFRTIFYAFILQINILAHPVAMIRKSIMIDNNIWYDPKFTTSQDYKLWNDLKYVTEITNIQECLLKYRCHDNSLTFKMREKQLRYMNAVIVREFKNNFGKFDISYLKIIQREFSELCPNDICNYLEVISTYDNERYKSKMIKLFLRCKMRNKYNLYGLLKNFRLAFLKKIFYLIKY